MHKNKAFGYQLPIENTLKMSKIKSVGTLNRTISEGFPD